MPLLNQNKLVASVASAHTSVSTGPSDVCKTPTPGGPVPMPYPNIALSTTMGPGYTTKTLCMATPMWTKKGKSAVSNGDQPGVALGIMSNKIMGMCEYPFPYFYHREFGVGRGSLLERYGMPIR